MNYRQYLLIKLAEECNEVAQMAIKCALFGYESKDPREKDGDTNFQKLVLEMLDVTAVGTLLDKENRPEDAMTEKQATEYLEMKQKKLKYYYEVSQQVKHI